MPRTPEGVMRTRVSGAGRFSVAMARERTHDTADDAIGIERYPKRTEVVSGIGRKDETEPYLTAVAHNSPCPGVL